MPKLHLPTRLRPHVGGQSVVNLHGETVAALLNTLRQTHPGIGPLLYENDTQIKKYTKIFVNDTDIAALSGTETALTERDTVYIVQAMAGG